MTKTGNSESGKEPSGDGSSGTAPTFLDVGCRVYWGSHGCHKPRGHEGPCWCDCCECENHPDDDSGCVAGPPWYGPRTTFYGEDVEARGLNTRSDWWETCTACGRMRESDKPDPCLGMLDGVWAACCGHGDTEHAYVAPEGGVLYREDAERYFAEVLRGTHDDRAAVVSEVGSKP